MEKECYASPSGLHCWHDNSYWTTAGKYGYKICCYCGLRVDNGIPQHGPHKPVDGTNPYTWPRPYYPDVTPYWWQTPYFVSCGLNGNTHYG